MTQAELISFMITETDELLFNQILENDEFLIIEAMRLAFNDWAKYYPLYDTGVKIHQRDWVRSNEGRYGTQGLGRFYKIPQEVLDANPSKNIYFERTIRNVTNFRSILNDPGTQISPFGYLASAKASRRMDLSSMRRGGAKTFQTIMFRENDIFEVVPPMVVHINFFVDVGLSITDISEVHPNLTEKGLLPSLIVGYFKKRVYSKYKHNAKGVFRGVEIDLDIDSWGSDGDSMINDVLSRAKEDFAKNPNNFYHLLKHTKNS